MTAKWAVPKTAQISTPDGNGFDFRAGRSSNRFIAETIRDLQRRCHENADLARERGWTSATRIAVHRCDAVAVLEQIAAIVAGDFA